jgi:hypothetical protein
MHLISNDKNTMVYKKLTCMNYKLVEETRTKHEIEQYFTTKWFIYNFIFHQEVFGIWTLLYIAIG